MNFMEGMLSNPAIQAVLIPLICGFVVAMVLNQVGTLWQGLAILAGFLAAVILITGLSFQPLTSTRKIILCSLALPALGLLLDWMSQKRWLRATSLATLLAAAALWVSWPVLGRQEGMEVLVTGARVALFAAWIGGSIVWFGRDRSYQQGGIIIALGIGVGASAVLAASALYGQLSFAIAAATGGLLLSLLIKNSSQQFGSLGVYAAATPLALLGGAATVYAKLPLSSLLCMIFIPLFAAIPIYRQGNVWVRSTISTLMGLLPVIPAIWIAWKVAGSVPL